MESQAGGEKGGVFGSMNTHDTRISKVGHGSSFHWYGSQRLCTVCDMCCDGMLIGIGLERKRNEQGGKKKVHGHSQG